MTKHIVLFSCVERSYHLLVLHDPRETTGGTKPVETPSEGDLSQAVYISTFVQSTILISIITHLTWLTNIYFAVFVLYVYIL